MRIVLVASLAAAVSKARVTLQKLRKKKKKKKEILSKSLGKRPPSTNFAMVHPKYNSCLLPDGIDVIKVGLVAKLLCLPR